MGDVSTVRQSDCGGHVFDSLRIGQSADWMLAGNANLLKYVRKVSSPYNVNGVALDCLPVALADEEYITWY